MSPVNLEFYFKIAIIIVQVILVPWAVYITNSVNKLQPDKPRFTEEAAKIMMTEIVDKMEEKNFDRMDEILKQHAETPKWIEMQLTANAHQIAEMDDSIDDLKGDIKMLLMRLQLESSGQPFKVTP